MTARAAGRVSTGWQRGPALQTLSAPSPALLPGSCTPTPETGWWSPPGSCAPGVPASPTLCPLCPLCRASPPASFQSHVLDPKPAHRSVLGTSEGRDHLELSAEGHWVSDGLCWAMREGYPAPPCRLSPACLPLAHSSPSSSIRHTCVQKSFQIKLNK